MPFGVFWLNAHVWFHSIQMILIFLPMYLKFLFENSQMRPPSYKQQLAGLKMHLVLKIVLQTPVP